MIKISWGQKIKRKPQWKPKSTHGTNSSHWINTCGWQPTFWCTEHKWTRFGIGWTHTTWYHRQQYQIWDRHIMSIRKNTNWKSQKDGTMLNIIINDKCKGASTYNSESILPYSSPYKPGGTNTITPVIETQSNKTWWRFKKNGKMIMYDNKRYIEQTSNYYHII